MRFKDPNRKLSEAEIMARLAATERARAERVRPMASALRDPVRVLDEADHAALVRRQALMASGEYWRSRGAWLGGSKNEPAYPRDTSARDYLRSIGKL